METGDVDGLKSGAMPIDNGLNLGVGRRYELELIDSCLLSCGVAQSLAMASMLPTSLGSGECAFAARSVRFLGLRQAFVKKVLEYGDGQFRGLFVELRPKAPSTLLTAFMQESGSD